MQRLIGVADQVVECLFHLGLVHIDEGQLGVKFQTKLNSAVLEFGAEKPGGLRLTRCSGEWGFSHGSKAA